jgi:hypothetical protein
VRKPVFTVVSLASVSGVTIGDVNNDNWEDIFVSNDFFERDYLYINQQDGTFKEDLTKADQFHQWRFHGR